MTGAVDMSFIHPRERVDVFGTARSKNTFPSLGDQVGGRKLSFKPLNICIITQDFVGPVKNGGIGTAYTYAAKAFSNAGHNVTVLFTIGACVDKTLDYWKDYYLELGINFVVLNDPDVPILKGQVSNSLNLNYKVFEWMKNHQDDFDFVHVSEWNANAYLCMQAKATGLYFENIKFVVKCSSPTLWNRIGNSEPISDIFSLSIIYMERRSVELADYVICGSRYLLNWMEDQGYLLPINKTFVQPNIFPIDDVIRTETTNDLVHVEELVFFGRLEPRKGLHFFVDALLALQSKGFFDINYIPNISLLGKPKVGYDYKSQIAKLESALGIEIQLLDKKNQPQALDYLSSKPGRVAVLPSLMDNSPFGVYECLARGIPFITSTAGGGKELISEKDWPNVLFKPAPIYLSEALERIIVFGCKMVEPSFDFEKNINDWMQWHLHISANLERTKSAVTIKELKEPLVSVCIAHYNRGSLLINAIDSVLQQTYSNIEILVIDDGSTDQESIEILKRIENSKDYPDVRIIRQGNRYLGAVRNTAISESIGEYILFMDDDNEAKPHEVEVFLRAAKTSDGEILTCFADSFSGNRPHSSSSPAQRVVFQGENLALGLVKNPFGDSNCFIKREVAEGLGGFTEHYKVGRDDTEFLARAILSGRKVMLIPEALYWYRINKRRMRNEQYSHFSGLVRIAEPYTQGLHPDLANLLRYAQSVSEARGDRRSKKIDKKNITISTIYSRLTGRQLPNNVIEFGRRLVIRYPSLYGLANKIYHRL